MKPQDFDNMKDWQRDKAAYDKKKQEEELERRKQLPDGGRVGDFAKGVTITALILGGIVLLAFGLIWIEQL